MQFKPTAMIAKCGCNCSRCPTYKETLRTFKDRQRCSDGWKKYLGIRLSPEKLRPCDGCQVPDEKRKVYYLNCIVRRCAIKNGIKNCAYCSAYPCEEVMNLHEIQKVGAKDRIAARLGAPVPQKDYLLFIEPYEGIKHLNEIRSSLDPNDIVEVTKVSLKSRIIDFPNDLQFSSKEKAAFESLHNLLSSINGPIDGISYARREVVKKRRPFLLALLWTFGLCGHLNEEEKPYLVIDSKANSGQRNQAVYSKVKNYFKILEDYGVHCELIPLVEKGWLTPGGGLRAKVGKNEDPAWLMKMSFDHGAGGLPALKALQKYTNMLNKKCGKKAFKFFSEANMRVLREEIAS